MPLTWERTKVWTQQFEVGPERTLAWLILRNLVFRTDEQLRSSFRQSIKSAVEYFNEKLNPGNEFLWRNHKNEKRFDIYCGPPIASSNVPGKSGELVARLINQQFGIKKWYAYDIVNLNPDERFLIVDDGTFTGEQLITFFDNAPHLRSVENQIAVVVAIAHDTAIAALARRYPKIPLFYGERLSVEHCFEGISEYWVSSQQWPYAELSPKDVYENVCLKHGINDKSAGIMGFGALGIMVGYAHGIPDDSLSLLWKRSNNWIPLIDREAS
jgi:hypothetical protein